MIKMPWKHCRTGFHTDDYAVLAAKHVGDVVWLDGEYVKITKKTNFACAVEPYRWYNRVEDWLLEKLGRFLP
jgi:hypothetical protein